jgi:hypothetical protein
MKPGTRSFPKGTLMANAVKLRELAVNIGNEKVERAKVMGEHTTRIRRLKFRRSRLRAGGPE